MNLEQAALIGEMIGGMGVVLSLLFLASELRRNTRQSQRDAMALLTSKRNEMMNVLMENPELSAIVWRCLSGQRVPAHEWSRFSVYLYTNMVNIELGFKKIWANEVDPVTAETWREGADWWLKYPGMRFWWKTIPVGLSHRFRDYIDQRLEAIEVDGRECDKVVASLPEKNK
jgi:hypothetical protein